MLNAQTLLNAHDKVTDRLTRKKEEQTVNQLVRGVFAGVTFDNGINHTVDSDAKKEKRNPFSTEGILTKPRKKKNAVLHTIPMRKVKLTTPNKKTIKNMPQTKRSKSDQPKTRSTLNAPVNEDNYENNWDTNLLDSVSENVAKWIVHEKFEPKDEEDYAQRAKLMALVNRKFGTVTPHEHVELIPEDISETDIEEFHQNCLEMGIDLHRLDRVAERKPIPEEDRITLWQFVRNHCKRTSVMFKTEVKRKVLNRTCFTAALKKNKNPFDLFKLKVDDKYHFVTSNDFEQKLINDGKSVKYDRAQDVLTIPTTDEKFKVTWQNVYPTSVNLSNGTHKGMIKWDAKPEQIKMSKLNLAKSKLAKKTSDQHLDKDKDIEGPIIYVACKDWQSEWSIAQNWKQLTFHQIRFKLKSIQASEREDAIFSLCLAVIESRMEQGIEEEKSVILPEGLTEQVIEMLDDETVRIRIIAAIIINTLPLEGYKESIDKLLTESMEGPVEFPDKVLISIMATLYGLNVNHRTCESLLRKYFIEPSSYLLQLMQTLSANGNLMHAVTAEYLNSCIWEERSAATSLLGQLDQSRLSAVMMRKIIDLAWVDKNQNVRKSAILAITRSMKNEKVVELCHSKMITDLQSDDTIVRGLDMIMQFNFISDQLRVFITL